MQQNPVGWFEIYVSDINRAANFYQTVFDKTLENLRDPNDDTVEMKSFAADMGVYGAGGALVKRAGVEPGTGGTVVYFGVDDCAVEESRVESAGGKVIQSKQSIGEFGWFSLCMDTEGNLFGLSSMQ